MIAALLVLLAALLFWLALRLRRQTGLPWAQVAASDTGPRAHLERPLFAAHYRLTGKPDYLLRQGAAYVPVEVKPTRRAPQPYAADLLQLAAYCLLVEACYEQPPPYGLLRYADTTFRLDYTPIVRAELLDLLDEMRDAADEPDCDRSHDDARRCRGCGFAAVCDQAMQ